MDGVLQGDGIANDKLEWVEQSSNKGQHNRNVDNKEE